MGVQTVLTGRMHARVARLTFLTPNLRNLAFFKQVWRQTFSLAFWLFCQIWKIWLFCNVVDIKNFVWLLSLWLPGGWVWERL